MSSFVDTMRQLGPSRLGIMGAILIGLLLFFVFVSMRVSSPDMKVIYSDLSTSDSSAMAGKLQAGNIVFDVSADGTRILVPDKDVGRARLLLAAAGLPNGGSMGYEIFDKDSGFGTTNFVQNINQVRALEGELARTISSLQGVQNSRVHIVLPQRELFSRESRQSSASVFIGLRGGSSLESSQISAIQSLVASAVPGLKVSNVSIIDNNGTLLARGGDEEVNLMTMKTEEMRRNYESNLTSKIEDQISRIVGYGNVRATVTAEINFDRINTNEELFDPEQQVVRSSQITNEESNDSESSSTDVSVENNLPGADSSLLGGGPTSSSNRTEEVTNFEIGKTIRSTVREVGEIKNLSVAVLVDGRYKPAETPAAEGEEKKEDKDAKPQMVYEPRSKEEIDQITALVKSSVGFNEDRGDKVEVVNMQFAAVDVEDPNFVDDRLLLGFDKNKLLDVAEIVTVAIMIILVVMLVLQPMVNRLLISEAPEIDNNLEADLLGARPMSPALAGPVDQDFMAQERAAAEERDSLINIQGVEGKVKASSVKKVEEIIENYPNETVSVLRSWMTQEPGA